MILVEILIFLLFGLGCYSVGFLRGRKRELKEWHTFVATDISRKQTTYLIGIIDPKGCIHLIEGGLETIPNSEEK